MTKLRNRWKMRLISGVIAASMMFGVLPFSSIILALEKEVGINWVPQEQTADGKVEVQLAANLNSTGEDLAGAMVEIQLDATEKKALQWDGESVVEETLGEEEKDPSSCFC